MKTNRVLVILFAIVLVVGVLMAQGLARIFGEPAIAGVQRLDVNIAAVGGRPVLYGASLCE